MFYFVTSLIIRLDFLVMFGLVCLIMKTKRHIFNRDCIMVDMPNLVINLIRTPIFEWCVVRCGSKDGDTRNPCV